MSDITNIETVEINATAAELDQAAQWRHKHNNKPELDKLEENDDGQLLYDGEPILGTPGKSAYETWLEQGNEGTEQDFLDSLKGENGVTAPVDGFFTVYMDDDYSLWCLIKAEESPLELDEETGDLFYVLKGAAI